MSYGLQILWQMTTGSIVDHLSNRESGMLNFVVLDFLVEFRLNAVSMKALPAFNNCTRFASDLTRYSILISSSLSLSRSAFLPVKGNDCILSHCFVKWPVCFYHFVWPVFKHRLNLRLHGFDTAYFALQASA